MDTSASGSTQQVEAPSADTAPAAIDVLSGVGWFMLVQ
jgi:hypothetical protein